MRRATSVGLLVLLAAAAPCSAERAPPRRRGPPPPLVRAERATRADGGRVVDRAAPRRPDLLAAGMPGGTAGGVAGVALASEVVQIVNTFIALLVFNRLTGAGSFAGLVDAFASWFVGLGWVAYPVYAALLLTITILPLMSALLFIVLAGTVFGPVKGTAMVSLSLSTAAAAS